VTDTPTTAELPGKPRRVSVTRGKRDRPLTLRVTWRAPSATGDAPITGYEVAVFGFRADGRLARVATRVLSPRKRYVNLRLAAGRYRFSVAAVNALGEGPHSARTPWRRPR
jgi:hypothetical protein